MRSNNLRSSHSEKKTGSVSLECRSLKSKIRKPGRIRLTKLVGSWLKPGVFGRTQVQEEASISLDNFAKRSNRVKTDRDDLTKTVLRTSYSSLDDMGSVTPCATSPSYVARERSIAETTELACIYIDHNAFETRISILRAADKSTRIQLKLPLASNSILIVRHANLKTTVSSAQSLESNARCSHLHSRNGKSQRKDRHSRRTNQSRTRLIREHSLRLSAFRCRGLLSRLVSLLERLARTSPTLPNRLIPM